MQLKSKIYSELNIKEFNLEKNNPYHAFDRKSQKVVLNPGSRYISSSLDDVF